MLVSAQRDEYPKTSALINCDDPLRPVQTYKAYYRVQQQRYEKGLRPISPTSNMKIKTKWLESYLARGCHKKPNIIKWTHEEIDDEEISCMYMARCLNKDLKRPSTFLREHNPTWKVWATLRNVVDKYITATHSASRHRFEFAGHLFKSGGS